METKYITDVIFDISKKENTKIASKVYNYLNSDAMSIVVSDRTYWFEFRHATYGCARHPSQEIRKYIDRKLNKMGYKSLYDI